MLAHHFQFRCSVVQRVPDLPGLLWVISQQAGRLLHVRSLEKLPDLHLHQPVPHTSTIDLYGSVFPCICPAGIEKVTRSAFQRGAPWSTIFTYQKMIWRDWRPLSWRMRSPLVTVGLCKYPGDPRCIQVFLSTALCAWQRGSYAAWDEQWDCKRVAGRTLVQLVLLRVTTFI